MKKQDKVGVLAIVLLISSGIAVTSGIFDSYNDPALIGSLALAHGVAILALLEGILGKK